MFTTSLTAAVLTGVFASGSLESPKWQSNYREAAAAAANLRKPIAVFIVSGSPGSLVKEGDLGKDAIRLLRDGFVPLTVNTSTADGQAVARTFTMSEGLVISDSTGGVQALRHAGGLTAGELKVYLERYAAPTAVVTTEYRGAAVTPTVVSQPVARPQYQPTFPPPVAQPQYQPVSQAQAVQPQYQPPSIQPQYAQPAYSPQYQPQYAQPTYQPQYSNLQPVQNRPVLNAVQNVGATALQLGANTLQYGANAVQNVGSYLSGST